MAKHCVSERSARLERVEGDHVLDSIQVTSGKRMHQTGVSGSQTLVNWAGQARSFDHTLDFRRLDVPWAEELKNKARYSEGELCGFVF